MRGCNGSRCLIAILALFVGVWSAGCFTYAPGVDRLAADLDRDLPGLELESGRSYKLGRLSLGLAKSLTRIAIGEEEEAERAAFAGLRGLKRVELGTYRLDGVAPDRLPVELQSSFQRGGWETLARFQDDGELGWVLYRLDRQDRLRNLVVLALDREELTVVRIGGRLDLLVTAALQFARDEVIDGAIYDEVASEVVVVKIP